MLIGAGTEQMGFVFFFHKRIYQQWQNLQFNVATYACHRTWYCKDPWTRHRTWYYKDSWTRHRTWYCKDSWTRHRTWYYKDSCTRHRTGYWKDSWTRHNYKESCTIWRYKHLFSVCDLRAPEIFDNAFNSVITAQWQITYNFPVICRSQHMLHFLRQPSNITQVFNSKNDFQGQSRSLLFNRTQWTLAIKRSAQVQYNYNTTAIKLAASIH